ncbi:hypothetical protein [Aeoliella sp.]|uniref:hypothetical protein n=1 Tax=Aeoliella sp. TaxID=2795800 RepID=UPI003CCBDBE4
MNDLEFARQLEQWHEGKLWHDEAPKPLRKGWAELEMAAAWKRWTDHLDSRKVEEYFDDYGSKIDPMSWGLPADDSPLGQVDTWRKELQRGLKKATKSEPSAQVESLLAELVHELENGSPSLPVALKALVVAYLLPQIASCISCSAWWRVVTAFKDLAEEVQKATTDVLEAETTTVSVLLGGELPLVLSVLLPELSPTRSLRSAARKSLGEGLLAATDGEGLVDAALLPVLSILFSSWTRARAIGELLKKGCWSSSADTQYEWVVRQVIGLQRTDGTPMLSSTPLVAWPAGVLDTALDLAGDDQDDTAAAARIGKRLLTIDTEFDEDDLPDPSVESEWSMLAVLANGWDKKSSRVLVDYSRPEMQIEVEADGRTLLSGGWGMETSYAGKLLEPTDEWEQQCWYSDDECDYLDLIIELSSGVRIERQIFLGKEDGFLLTHDILHGPSSPSGEWRHVTWLPLASGVKFVPEKNTRDGVLANGNGPRATVLPLALAEWRNEPRFGELTSNEGKLELAQQSRGARLSCPLWIDLNARRTSKPRTWRKLTVAASLEVAPSDVAVGYRAQIGDSQWLAYRSLAAPANRTVLGQNTAAEMMIGRFHRTGEFEELLAVDPA